MSSGSIGQLAMPIKATKWPGWSSSSQLASLHAKKQPASPRSKIQFYTHLVSQH